MRAFYPAIVWAIIIALISLLPADDMPPLHNEDKWAHVVFYAVLTFLIARALYRTRQNFKIAIRLFFVAFFVSGVYGAAIELVQLLYIDGRQGDLMDLMANLIGGLVALPLHWLLNVNY